MKWEVWLSRLGRTPRPPCFDSDKQWREWVAAAGDVSLKFRGPLHAGYCSDCTPEYQARMVAADRCGHENAFFVRVGPGRHAFEGRRPR